jgi:hypothetical protein
MTQLWESEQIDLFSAQQEPYSATWPTSGSMRSGRLYPQPPLEPPTDENDGSALPTPRGATDRTSRTAATRRDSRSAPSLEQAIEIASGTLPREFEDWEQLPLSWQP